MCMIKIDSRITSTPIVVLAVVVICGIGSALISRCCVDLNVRDPYVNDDLSWSINDGMDRRL